MGLFDLFDGIEEANNQFKKDVGNAWDELWKSSDGDDTVSNIAKTVAESIIDLPKPHSPVPSLLSVKDILKDTKESSQCTKPVVGSPVYCKLAGAVEHTGIYIGNGKIVHLNGDGNIEAVSPREFCARLGGINPTWTICFPQHDGNALGSRSIAERAKRQIGTMRNYNVVLDNCHQFTCGCLSGDFENPCNFFWMVEQEIRDKLGSFEWAEWDYE